MPKENEKETKPAEEAAAEAVEVETIVEKATLEVEKDIITASTDEEAKTAKPSITIDVDAWQPKTQLGQLVKAGQITTIDTVLDEGLKILETEIVDMLLPGMGTELLMVGQSRGKFGGGARRIFKQTQKKTPEGNKPHFFCFAVVGNENGIVGAGAGKSKDTVPAREKAVRNAKLNIFKIRRGCGSWQCHCATPHSIPFTVMGKCGGSVIELLPAPKGNGLVCEKEVAKILQLAGIKDVWSQARGQTRQKQNLITACIAALKQLGKTKVRPADARATGSVEGIIKKAEGEAQAT